MNDDQLQFDRTCHVIYSKPCKAEIREKIAHHYPESQREAVWERVQMQYVDFLSDWRTDLGGEKNFHNGPGGNYDCIALMAYYVVCRDVSSVLAVVPKAQQAQIHRHQQAALQKAPAPRVFEREKAVRQVGRL